MEIKYEIDMNSVVSDRLAIREKEKIIRKNSKLSIVQRIYEFKDILFGDVSTGATRHGKDHAWRCVRDYAVSIGFLPPDRDFKFMRNVFWQNMKRTAQNKLENYKNSGFMGKFCEKLKRQDYLVLEILGMEDELKNLPQYSLEDEDHDSMSMSMNPLNDVIHIKSDVDGDDEEVQVQKYEITENYTNGNHSYNDQHDDDESSDSSSMQYKHNRRKRRKIEPELIVPNVLLAEDHADETNKIETNSEEMETLKKHYLRLKVRKMELEILKLERELGVESVEPSTSS